MYIIYQHKLNQITHHKYTTKHIYTYYITLHFHYVYTRTTTQTCLLHKKHKNQSSLVEKIIDCHRQCLNKVITYYLCFNYG